MLNDVNDFTLINNFLLNTLETILYDFTHTFLLITLQMYKEKRRYTNILR